MFGKIGWQLDVEVHQAHHARIAISLGLLHQADALGGDATPLAEAQHIEAGACS